MVWIDLSSVVNLTFEAVPKTIKRFVLIKWKKLHFFIAILFCQYRFIWMATMYTMHTKQLCFLPMINIKGPILTYPVY